MMTSPSVLRRAWPLLLIVACLVLILATGLGHDLSYGFLSRRVDALRRLAARHPAGGVLAFVLLYVAIAAVSLPGGSVLTVTGGLVFGTILGGGASVLGASLGAILLFLAARHAIGAHLAGRSGPRLDRVRAGLERDGISYLLALRLLPVVPFWLVNLACGLLDVPLGRFAWTTALGIVPGTFVFASVGAGMSSIFDPDHPPGPGILLHPHIVLPLLGLSLLSLAPVAWRRLRVRRK